ncbi:hypothetical protein OH687_14200 [Burkholderia anthina]|nr:hypothetical protein OH687_14200 [Burkholderia anthina]
MPKNACWRLEPDIINRQASSEPFAACGQFVRVQLLTRVASANLRVWLWM